MWILDELKKFKDSECIAVRYRDEVITYRELWNRSERIGAYLQEKGLNEKPLVIYGNKEIDIISCMLAALKIGIPYVPVDTLYPAERLQKIMTAVKADALINFSAAFTSDAVMCFGQEELRKIYRDCNLGGVKCTSWVNNEDICYILFTSGSTGEPKGVPISKFNLINFANWFQRYIDSVNANGVINQAPYSFDLSVIGLYVCLPLGKYLFNVDSDMSSNFELLNKYLSKYNPEIWISTPSFMQFCLYDNKFRQSTSNVIRLIIFDGEVLPKKLAEELLNTYVHCSLINAYGPTEATVAISACEITADMLNEAGELPIGYLLDDGKMDIRPEYVNENGDDVGELCICSRSVAKGYYGSGEQSGKAFFSNMSGCNCYSTGDLVYERQGLLYYVGRKDFQIKLNGYRIELNDIEANLQKQEYIRSCCVIPVWKNNRVDFLCAFVALSKNLKESDLKLIVRIKKDLGDKIPAYMVPKKIVLVDEVPLTINGKIDRRGLSEGLHNGH